MAINAVEARISGYSDEQLAGLRRHLEVRAFKLAYGGDTIGSPSLAQIISGWPEITEAQRLADYPAEPEDATLLLRARRICWRLSKLDLLRKKLGAEAEERQLSEL